jgi:hypothetical protein
LGGLNFSLEEIKHGVLRSNKKPPGGFFKFFKSGEDRNKILPSVNKTLLAQ